MSTDVDAYIDQATLWHEEMAALRPILLGSGLDEQIKWAKPCYCHDGANVAIMQPMKEHLGLMFFKGPSESKMIDTSSARRTCGRRVQSRVHHSSCCLATQRTPWRGCR
jgi:uncharacterized protein YdeI (YjbR/CyaY-like superfamily)